MAFLNANRSFVLKAIVSASLLFILVAYVDVTDVANHLTSVDPIYLGIAFALYLSSQIIAAVKWHYLNPLIGLKTCFRFIFVGNYYSMILPGQMSGEIAKAWRLGRGKRNAEAIAASVLIDRVTGFIGLLLLATLGITYSEVPNTSLIELPLLLATSSLCLLLVLMASETMKKLAVTIARRFMSRFVILARQLPKVERVLDSLHDYGRSPAKLLASVLIGIMFQFVLVLLTFSLANSLDIAIALADVCWILGTISILIFLPITISGIGVREAGFVGLMAIVGVSSAAAFSLSLILFSLQILSALIGGVLEVLSSD